MALCIVAASVVSALMVSSIGCNAQPPTHEHPPIPWGTWVIGPGPPPHHPPRVRIVSDESDWHVDGVLESVDWRHVDGSIFQEPSLPIPWPDPVARGDAVTIEFHAEEFPTYAAAGMFIRINAHTDEPVEPVASGELQEP